MRSWMGGRGLWISMVDTDIGVGEERLVEIQETLKQGDKKTTGTRPGNIYRRVHGVYQDGEVFLYSRKGCGIVVQIASTGEVFR